MTTKEEVIARNAKMGIDATRLYREKTIDDHRRNAKIITGMGMLVAACVALGGYKLAGRK